MRLIGVGRADRGPIADWWWTVDRWTLAAVFALILIGALLSLAASPAVAMRENFAQFHFVIRQMIFIGPALIVLIGVSVLNVVQARRLALLLLIGAIAMMVLTLVIGPEKNGAHRWLDFGYFSLQPSEFSKPAFVVVAAWLLTADREQWRTGFIAPGTLAAIGIFTVLISILALQPDFGQAMLLACVFGLLMFVNGLSWGWIGLFGLAGIGGAVGAYNVMPHVASRVDRFLDPSSGDTYQIDRALDAFAAGGLFGRGPGEGEVKSILPDAHTDFIFAVAAEEYGVIAGLIIISLFGFVAIRSLLRVSETNDPFVQLAASGLAGLFAVQAFINMAVNVNLLPAKGMTLPFISYGGSSLLALSFTMGFLLAFTRWRAGRTPSTAVPASREAWA